MVAPRARQGVRYHYGDFLLPIAAVHLPDTIRDGQVSLTFDVEPGENPCAFSNYVTVISADVVLFVPYGVHHPGTSCKKTEMIAFQKLHAFNMEADSMLRIPLRVVICQQYREPIVMRPFVEMKHVRLVAPARPRNEDSIASFDAKVCRNAVDQI